VGAGKRDLERHAVVCRHENPPTAGIRYTNRHRCARCDVCPAFAAMVGPAGERILAAPCA
jgi:hypothetical protein